jgi:hypothetical protein
MFLFSVMEFTSHQYKGYIKREGAKTNLNRKEELVLLYEKLTNNKLKVMKFHYYESYQHNGRPF